MAKIELFAFDFLNRNFDSYNGDLVLQVKEKTDNCHVFKWENCRLVPTDVPFTVPKSYCTDMCDLKEEYETCQKEDETITTSQKICEVKSVPSCKSEVVKKVIRSTWESCHKLIQNAIYGLDIDTYFCNRTGID